MDLGKARQLMVFGFVALLMMGCGDRPTARKAPAKKPKATIDAKPVVAAEPAAYDSVPEALAAVEEMSTSGNPSSQELMRIEQWLTSKGSQAAPELSSALADPNRHLAVRITACRALSRLGPAGKEPLLNAASAEPRQLRLKATECLGRIKPTDKAIVDRLVVAMNAGDFDEQKAALSALANVGPAASKAEPKLVEKLTAILNDTKQDETLRGLAKATLKKVDPRTGLQNAH